MVVNGKGDVESAVLSENKTSTGIGAEQNITAAGLLHLQQSCRT